MSNLSDEVSDKIRRFLERSKAERIIVAYSGGLDSTVLLHLVKNLAIKLHHRILAVHVNHRLHPDADDWAKHCRRQATHIDVAFQTIAVQIPAAHPKGLEAAARDARYEALQSIMTMNDLLLTAHHQNDQAETVLLRLLRGSGTTGIKAIAEYRTLDIGALARPLLYSSHSDIRRYARENGLRYLEDPSNDDIKHARNYLRHLVVPVVAKRWPQWYKTVARYAKHRTAADYIIDTEAKRYLQHCLLPGSLDLLIRVFITLATEHRHAVLRAWCKLNDVPLPNHYQIVRICAALSRHINKHNGSGSAIIYTCSDIGMGVYHGTLRTIKPLKRALVSPIKWHSGGDCEISQLNLKLLRTELMRQAPSLSNKTLEVKFRRGGERCACSDHLGNLFHKSLKNIFQEHHVPSWQRDKIPLIYAHGRLRLVWGITECN